MTARHVAGATACSALAIGLGCGAAIARGAIAPVLAGLAAAVPLVWALQPARVVR